MSESMRVREGRRGSWLWAAFLVLLAATLAAGAFLYFRETPRTAAVPYQAFQPMTSWQGSRISVKLYFPLKDGSALGPETRSIREYPNKAEQARELVGELLKGPLTEGLIPSLPPDARVKAVFIDKKGTAFVDFSREVQTEFPGGAWTETLALYSLTNTLTANFPEITQVQVLVEGEVVDTLAGHIDTSRPFQAKTSLNKE